VLIIRRSKLYYTVSKTKKTYHEVESVRDDRWLRVCNVGMYWENIDQLVCTVLLMDGTFLRNTVERL